MKMLLTLVASLCLLFSASAAVTDCQQSEWGPWSTTCSRSCNGGLETRTRTVTVEPQPPTAIGCGCDLVLAVDTSYSIADADWAALKALATTAITQLDGTKLGIVAFDAAPTDVIALTDNKDALTAAVEGLQRCDGINKVGCYGQRATFGAVANARAMLEAEMAANPTRSACRVILTITHGPPSDVAPGPVTSLPAAHPDWGLLVAAVGPNAWVQPLMSIASSADFITELAGFSDLATAAPSLLGQCSRFPKSVGGPLLSPCNCDYVIVSDLSYGPKGGTAQNLATTWNNNFDRYTLSFYRNLIDKTSGNKFGFVGFNKYVTAPMSSPTTYLFDNVPTAPNRDAMYTVSHGGVAVTGPSALAQLTPCLNEPVNCTTRATYDALRKAVEILETEDATRQVCKVIVLSMNNDFTRPQDGADANKNIIDYIKGKHPEWGVVVVAANGTAVDMAQYQPFATSPLNVLSFPTFTDIFSSAADKVLQICPDPDQNRELPLPCGPAEEHQICNADSTCDQPCELGPAAEVSACNAPCGGGKQFVAKPLLQEPSGPGAACDFTNVVEQQDCNTQVCAADCSFQWNAGACSVTCGAGTLTETYEILHEGAGGGAACEFANGDTRSQTCENPACPVDCVGHWSGQCSVTCGEGSYEETFVIDTQAANGGRCPDAGATRTKQCDVPVCPTCATVLTGGVCPASSGKIPRTGVDFATTPCVSDEATCIATCCENAPCQAYWKPTTTCSVSCGGAGTLEQTFSLADGFTNEGTGCEAALNDKRTVTCNLGRCYVPPVCGDGQLEWSKGEQCEPPNKGCCDSECKFVVKGTVCRPAVGECDAADTCTGINGQCPPNGQRYDGIPCNVKLTPLTNEYFVCAGGKCIRKAHCGNGKIEKGEDCDGGLCCDEQCRYRPATVMCRNVTEDACDLAEFCTGDNGRCPPDRHVPDGKICMHPVTKKLARCQKGYCLPAASSFSASSSSSSSHHHH